MGIPFGAGMQFLLDAQQRFTRAVPPVSFRAPTRRPGPPHAAGGAPYSPTGVAAGESGYTDILIDPPPAVQDVSLHNIGLLAGRLNFGSRIFLVSNTFVQNQLNEYENIPDPYAVFRQRDGYQAIGLFYNNRMFAIESITHKEVAATTIIWKLGGNALEIESDSTQV